MVKIRIEQDIRDQNFGARNGNYERKVTKQRVHENSWRLLAMGVQRVVF